ncbi:MAG: diguanylate cyclase, partial [Clostridia bacterium]|nr:diguanylate cyclase [Clostridia bacterium]
MKTTVVATEILSIMVLLMLLYGSIFEVNRKIKKNNVYILSVVLCILALVADMLAWILDGTAAPERLIFMSDLLTYVLGYVIITSYSFYIMETVREKKPVPTVFVRVILTLAIAAVVFVVIGSFANKVFYIENGSYHTGPWYRLTQIFTGLVMLFNLYLILSNAKLFGRHDTIALMSYIVFPIIATVLHFVLPDISLTYIASMFSQVTIYIMLQAEQEAEFRTRERILLEVSNTDTLTRLQNRRAYDEARFKLRDIPFVNALFLDVNGLKYTNDNFGHKAGDELITGFGNIL